MPNQTVSEKDVQKARERVEKLRERLADTEASVVLSEADRNNAVRKASLDAEAERLEAQIAAAKDRLKLSKGAEDRIIEQVQDAATPEVVDTTPEPQFDDNADSTKEK